MKRVGGIFLLVAALALAAGSVRAQTRQQKETTPAMPASTAPSPDEIALEPEMHEAPTPHAQPATADDSIEQRSPLAPGSDPMSVGGKLSYAALHGLGPRAVASAAFMGAYSQLRDTDSGFGQGGEGYGKRVASKYGTYATRELIGSFALASVFRQDPRFRRSQRTDFLSRLNYAVTREFIARGDNGNAQVNVSRMGGAAAAVFIAGQWRPGYTNRDAAEDAGLVIATDILQNVVAEFWPDIRRKLRH